MQCHKLPLLAAPTGWQLLLACSSMFTLASPGHKHFVHGSVTKMQTRQHPLDHASALHLHPQSIAQLL